MARQYRRRGLSVVSGRSGVGILRCRVIPDDLATPYKTTKAAPAKIRYRPMAIHKSPRVKLLHILVRRS